MPTIEVLKFRLEREPLTPNPQFGRMSPSIYYKVWFEDRRRPPGDARVIFEPLGCLTLDIGEAEMYQRLCGIGLQDDATISSLTDFYPNGVIDEAYAHLMRQGVGARVFDAIVGDCVERGARAMVTHTSSASFRQFLRKRGFGQVTERDFYRLLTQAPS